VGACTGSIREEGRANGGTVVAPRPGLAPQGVNNLGEALAAICSLTCFPPMPGAPAYKLWEVRLEEPSSYVQRYPAVERCDPLLSSERLGERPHPVVGLLMPRCVRLLRDSPWPAPPNLPPCRAGQQHLLWCGAACHDNGNPRAGNGRCRGCHHASLLGKPCCHRALSIRTTWACLGGANPSGCGAR
jgi:hypothetical protein